MMKEGMEGVWKEVWRDPASAINDTKPKPIRGYLRNPDYRSGRDPLTGREGYATIYEARKKKQTLIHHKPVKPIQSTRKSDFELVYRENNVKDDDREDYRRRTNDIRRKTSDIILKEQRFRDEQLNYLRMDREYKKERKEIVNSVEKEHARSQYQPWGKPGGGAPAITTRRTKEMELKEKTNHPAQQHPVRFPYEIFRARTRQDDIPPANTTKLHEEGDSVEPVRTPHANQISSYDFLTNFGKPGSGAPYKNSKRTLMLNERFDNKVKDHHWIQTDAPDQLGVKTTQLTTETKIGHGVLPNKPKITTTTTVGPSVSPTSKPRAMDSSQVVDILFPRDNTSAVSVKGSPSNPKKITLPRHSKEKLPPWEK